MISEAEFFGGAWFQTGNFVNFMLPPARPGTPKFMSFRQTVVSGKIIIKLPFTGEVLGDDESRVYLQKSAGPMIYVIHNATSLAGTPLRIQTRDGTTVRDITKNRIGVVRLYDINPPYGSWKIIRRTIIK